ncbi:hypothetical protein M422DRAFT_156450 [Sphaerobolus stellatus SS14]|nr:hypothetical protein M422DRAFT_156450 [Sphaerobolus stellatus SS14]
MQRGECQGWLRVYIPKNSAKIRISLKHVQCHEMYEDIELPEKWKEFIRANLKMTPAQIWRYILREEGGKGVRSISIPFRQKSVYYYWHKLVQDQWLYADDPYESAQAYLQQAGPEMHLEQLNVQAQPGTRSLGFQVSDLVAEWGPHTQELAMDSTWNTNKQNFEIFAAVGEAKGIGIPLAYLLVSTSKDAHPGAKQKIIESWLTSLKSLGINPEFILTDKDQAEINAVRIVWPHSKHQLCFWHALKAIKRRLAKNKSTPTPYNAQKAHEHFQFIDPNFLPRGQQKPGQEVFSSYFVVYLFTYTHYRLINQPQNLSIVLSLSSMASQDH